MQPSADASRRWALVTGCSAGLGKALVGALRGRGWGVVATARRLEDLQDLPEGADLRRAVLDVTRPGDIDGVLAACADLRLVALVNNAGYGQMAPLELLRVEDLRTQFETNVIGLQAVTNACLPRIRACAGPGEGRIVHVSSALGRLSIPLVGAYNASKHAVVALAETLRLEVGQEIAVILVEPGVVETGFRANLVRRWGDLPSRAAGTPYAKALAEYEARGLAFPDQRALDAARCAARIVRAMDRRRPPRRLIIGADSFWSQLAHRWLPASWYEAAVRKSYGLG